MYPQLKKFCDEDDEELGVFSKKWRTKAVEEEGLNGEEEGFIEGYEGVHDGDHCTL